MLRTKTDKAQPSRGDVNAAAVRMLELIDALIEVVGEENRGLARGIPASIAQFVGQKSRLADEFEALVADAKLRMLVVGGTEHELRTRLVERSSVLRRAMDENLERLNAAIDATRRRVDSVMRALREQVSEHGIYRANGHAQAIGMPSRMQGGKVI
jgi:hypothetical protein